MALARDVIIARGTSEKELEKVAHLLQDAEIPFELDEGVGADPQGPSWAWHVRVPVDRIDAARRALAAERQIPATPEPSSRPLFDSHAPRFIRIILTLASFGLAGGLWLQTCGVT